MSSLLRRIQRQVSPSRKIHPKLDLDGKPTGEFYANPPREKFWQGRGDKLGVKNPKDKARVARLAREARQRSAK